MKTLSFAVNYWSKGEMKAYFLRHEGYLGAVGAFVKGNTSVRNRAASFLENFTRSHIGHKPTSPMSSVGVLELLPAQLLPFPLLFDVHSYVPDLVDLAAGSQSDA